MCVCAWVWEYTDRHLGMSCFLQAINQCFKKKQCISAAGLNQCYGWFMDCAHPISSLIKQEQCGNGGSVAPHSPQDYFRCLLEPKDFALCDCCSAMLTRLFYYEQIQFFPAPSLLKRVLARRTQEAVHSISFPFEKQCSGNDKCVRPIEEPSGQ